ncbi:ATP-binding cassette domain-containing protein [Kribbella pittospori]|uniref:UvrABC system protein A n=1 Tax=Kribbella pittospori TaxID=722689 RepID=A0A4R0JJB5_9ACTN|nr:ATP-binding cassette domain-containing protein [Kribbella pittospori]TCC44798.1 ATP-binding cassette domain-containing protein [Kribbella pittospori]
MDRRVVGDGAVGRARARNGRFLEVLGAAEHNLRDVEVSFGPGLTAVVGVSGSGKSSLAFDVVYAEARRRFVESLALGGNRARVPAARVRRIEGLGPAVAVAQNVLNRNPASTVATSVGLHPFLRILYSRFAEVECPHCDVPVRALSAEERLTTALDLLARNDGLDVEVAIVRGLVGSHARLLAGVRDQFAQVTVDGGSANHLDPAQPHDIVVRVATLQPGVSAAEVRATLEQADALGRPEVLLSGTPVLRAPICPRCGAWVRPLSPSAFKSDNDTSSHRIAGLTFQELIGRSVTEVLDFVQQLPLRARRIQEELERRLRPLQELGLGYLALDRSMPTLSRGEAQRTRLAVVLSGRLEDLLHVLDEPTIGLHHSDLSRLLHAIAALPGPVLMVEHDPLAVAMADDVVEIGPGGGGSGGQLVFQGPPADLWRAKTASGIGFSAGARRQTSRRPVSDDRIRVTGASLRNLRAVDCEIPLGSLTVITGPSGAGKTTLSHDVLLASLRKRGPIGCTAFAAPVTRARAVDQAPLGNNPRSNPATYTKVLDRIRDVFANETGRSASEFTFNRAEGACPDCEGMGSVAIGLSYLAPIWVRCEACDGQRYRPEVLEATWADRSIADVLALSVDEAAAMFAEHPSVTRILGSLQEVGLGYLTLGQPSPSLSGGEAQRVRLAREVAKARSGDLVLLDEPTTGLHPGDLDRLLAVLDRLTDNGCTVVVVEHQPDVIAAADWRIDLGPGGGPHGGRLQHCGPPVAEKQPKVRPRTKPRTDRRSSDAIRVRGARAHNLQGVDVDFAKDRFTVVTGVSGSGKSSLVGDILESEATRRLLECLSVYERQSVREGPEAPVDSLTGLGPTMSTDPSGSRFDGRGPGFYVWDANRVTVGRSSDLDRLLAVIIARAGVRTCLACGRDTVRRTSPKPEAAWSCDDCGTSAVPIEPRHLVGSPVSACPQCLGLGVEREFDFPTLIVDPDVPIYGGVFGGSLAWFGTTRGEEPPMRSLAERYRFDFDRTPWKALSDEAQHAVLYGDAFWRGLNAWAANDVGGNESTEFPCRECAGRRLRTPYLAIRLQGRGRDELFSTSFADLETVLTSMDGPDDQQAAEARSVVLRRLGFLRAVGLGYLQLNRSTWTLSAGEAQRVKLASVLGDGLVGMTVLLDEPSRGLHPSEVTALARTLTELRAAGNTVIAVEHDPIIIRAADDVIEIGPGPGRTGGRVVELDSPQSVTRAVLDGRVPTTYRDARREPTGWMQITRARENNLDGLDVRVPLGVLVGVCGMSGSGKSTLVVDTIALGLTPPKTNIPGSGVIRVRPGEHDAISGAPQRTVVADQSRAEITSPGMFLGLIGALRKQFAASEAAVEQGITIKDLTYQCDACKGKGAWQQDMSFLPSVPQTCDACGGSGYRREAATLLHRGRSLADIEALTIAEVVDEWGDIDAVRRVGGAAVALGLGYLVVRQPGWSLSGGEAQRLKLAKEFARTTKATALYILDEPTVGLQATDVAVLVRTLDTLIAAGNSVLVVEHDPAFLAACDWLIELGPGAGPDGGRIVFEGPPDALAEAGTATAPHLAEVLP